MPTLGPRKFTPSSTPSGYSVCTRIFIREGRGNSENDHEEHTLKNKFKNLEKRIGYRFKKRALLEVALTHPSYVHEAKEDLSSNQRLEFLGDAVLSLLTADHMYNTRPENQEGKLTKERTNLTNMKTLARIADRVGLGEYLRLGKGEDASGGAKKPSNLCDGLEAVMGAAYLDGGIKGARKIFQNIFVPALCGEEDLIVSGNPKGDLQEKAQGEGFMNPAYEVIDARGPAHEKEFTAVVKIGNIVIGQGSGANKRSAHSRAAEEALRRIGNKSLTEVIETYQGARTIQDTAGDED